MGCFSTTDFLVTVRASCVIPEMKIVRRFVHGGGGGVKRDPIFRGENPPRSRPLPAMVVATTPARELDVNDCSDFFCLK